MNPANWDDIRIFLAVAEAGSLSGAAEALGLSQPTAGRRIKALETALGVSLVERVSNRIELTEAGLRIQARAAGMIGLAEDLADEARAVLGQAPEPVRISATGSIALFLTEHLAELIERAGGVPFAIVGTREQANLARREADIALRMRRLPQEGDLVGRKVARVAFGVYGPPDAPATMLVIGLPGPERRPSQAAYLENWAKGRPVPVRLADVALRHRAVTGGRAITLLPCWLGDGDPTLGRLAPPPRDLMEDLFCVVRRDARPARPVDGIVRALTGLFKASAGRLAGG